ESRRVLFRSGRTENDGGGGRRPVREPPGDLPRGRTPPPPHWSAGAQGTHTDVPAAVTPATSPGRGGRGRAPSGRHGLRARPPCSPIGSRAGPAGSGRHSVTGTTPRSTSSRPSQHALVSSTARRLYGAA